MATIYDRKPKKMLSRRELRSQQRKPVMPIDKSSALLKDNEDTMSTVSDSDSINDDAAYLSAPQGFLCPLTMEIMFDPVLDAEGNTYERGAILEWLKQHLTSPISRQPLSEPMLNPNNSLREAIHEFMGEKWVRRKSEEIVKLQKGQPRLKYSFREKINCYLQLASSKLPGLPCTLSENGCCGFRHGGITVALDVPESVGVFCLYTRGLVSKLTEPMKDLLLEMNFLQADTRGGCLSVKRNMHGQAEVMFSYTDRVSEITARDFVNIIINFTGTALLVREKLIRAGERELLS